MKLLCFAELMILYPFNTHSSYELCDVQVILGMSNLRNSVVGLNSYVSGIEQALNAGEPPTIKMIPTRNEGWRPTSSYLSPQFLCLSATEDPPSKSRPPNCSYLTQHFENQVSHLKSK